MRAPAAADPRTPSQRTGLAAETRVPFAPRSNNFRAPWVASSLYYPPGQTPSSDGQGNNGGSGSDGGGNGGGRHLLDFNIKTAPPVSEEQWEWVAKTLNVSTADWLIVVGNSPVWSAGSYGPTWPLVQKLAPLMEANGVSLYINGRDQIMQHITCARPPAAALRPALSC